MKLSAMAQKGIEIAARMEEGRTELIAVCERILARDTLAGSRNALLEAMAKAKREKGSGS